jgi:hypothetical protein
VVRLKVKHIDSAQKIIRVEQSKGRKDRNVSRRSVTRNKNFTPVMMPPASFRA